ncbi:MAG: flavodoxin domain-containing protein [Planctomycetota bacterium]
MASILVLYHSQEHGNTAAMAEAVAEGARAAGAEVTVTNTNEARMAVDEYCGYDGVAFGTPDYFSYVAGGLKVFIDDWLIAKRGAAPDGLEDKPYALFYSHGGGGKVREPFETLFERVGAKVGETVESKGAPDEPTLARCRALGAELARACG